MEETSGALELQKKVIKGDWPHTLDAQVWASKFKELFPESDEGLMLGWFANAIMAGYDTAQGRQARELQELRAWKAKAMPFLEKVHYKYRNNNIEQLTELLGGSDE